MPPLEEPVLFIDRSLGKHIIINRLRAEGMKVEAHDDHLPLESLFRCSRKRALTA